MMNFKIENGGITILDKNNIAIAEIWRRGNTEKELQYAHLFSNAYSAFEENEALQKKIECLQHKIICLQKKVKKLEKARTVEKASLKSE